MDDLFKLSRWELKDLETLVPNPKNDNKHKEEHVDLLARVMKARGVRHPIIVSKRSGFIVAGHLRLAAAKRLGLEKYPVEVQDFKDEADEYAFLTSDNNVARYAELDEVKMLENLKGLDVDVETLDFQELGLLDFELPEVEVLPEGNEDATPELAPDPVTKKGDVWLLGNHRVLCGDSTLIDDVEKLMKGEKAELILTDPPYDYKKMGDNGAFAEGHKKLKESIAHISKFDPDGFLQTIRTMQNENFNSYIFCNTHLVYKYLYFAESNKLNYAILTWHKKSFIPASGNHHFPDTEYIIYISKGATFNSGLNDCYYGKWWHLNTERSKEHPTVKPQEILQNIIKISSSRKSNVFDAFLGSGSTLIACEKTKRKCYGMELDEQYCDVIVKRWQDFTGKEAKLEATGQTFNELLK